MLLGDESATRWSSLPLLVHPLELGFKTHVLLHLAPRILLRLVPHQPDRTMATVHASITSFTHGCFNTLLWRGMCSIRGLWWRGPSLVLFFVARRFNSVRYYGTKLYEAGG